MHSSEEKNGRTKMWILLLLNSVTAYVANLSNFLVTKHTSALTLQVLGNAKGAVAVVNCDLNSFVKKFCCCWHGWVYNNSVGGSCIWRNKEKVWDRRWQGIGGDGE